MGDGSWNTRYWEWKLIQCTAMHNKFRNNPHPLPQEKTGEVEICRDNFNFMARS
jgi:hypothetical protein